MLAQMELFVKDEELDPVLYPHGRKKDGTPRQRPVKELEFEIFDWLAADVPEDHPDHIQFQKIVNELCAEFQAQWSESEFERRRTVPVSALEMGVTEMGN